MKYTIEGFSQEYLVSLKKTVERNNKEVEIKIDGNDIILLRWFVDFFPTMKKMSIDGKEFAWVSFNKLSEDLPILDISKRSLSDRLKKLVDFGILDYRLIKEGGTFSMFAFGPEYFALIDSKNNKEGVVENDTGGAVNCSRGVQSTEPTLCSQLQNKDNSIKDKSIKDNNSLPPYPLEGGTNKKSLTDEQRQFLEASKKIAEEYNMTYDQLLSLVMYNQPKHITESIKEKHYSKALEDEVYLWCQYKKERGQAYKQRGIRELLDRVDKILNEKGEQAAIDAIKFSIASNFQGLYEEKSNNYKATQQPSVPKQKKSRYTEADIRALEED